MLVAAMMAGLTLGLVAAVIAERKGGQDARAPRDGRFAGGTPSDERTWRP